MKESIFVETRQALVQLISSVIPEGAPIILGFSGGADSLFLFHLLRGLKYCLHVVHVDHGWRVESKEQMAMLQQYCAQFEVPFHGVTLPPFPGTGNLEEWSRDQRFSIFSSKAKELGSLWIFLGHQANDQAEVVLKRVLESASLVSLRGMQSIDQRDGLWIFRPLLSVLRNDIEGWLDLHGHQYIQDPSNRDNRFLRARMRTSIFPCLHESFGKNVLSSLNRLAHEAQLLEQFVGKVCSESARSVCESMWGYCEYIRQDDVSLFMARHLLLSLQKKLQFGGVPASVADAVAEVFCGQTGRKKFFLHAGAIVVEPRFFALFLKAPAPIQRRDFQGEGTCTWGGLEMTWCNSTASEPPSITWDRYLSGEPLSFVIPRSSFTVMSSNERLVRHLPLARKYISLRPYIPVVVQNGRIVADCVHGYTQPISGSAIHVTIRKV